MSKTITAYTDGSAVTKYPYLGGFGVYIKHGDKRLKIRKGFCFTKTGRMELTAVLYCLRAIKDKNILIKIYSDSMYVVNTCNEWIENWHILDYADKKNVDILRLLREELNMFSKRPRIVHIKGHQDVENEHQRCNAIADELANYKTQKDYEMDGVPKDLTEWEKDDFITKGNKQYYIS